MEPKRAVLKKVALYSPLLVLFLILSLLYLNNESLEGYQRRGYQCLELLEEGTLYGGQPFCVQGPMIYLTGWLLKLLFGLSHLQAAAKMLFLIISFLTFVLILKIIRKETSRWHPLVSLLLFIPLVFYPSQAGSILDVVLATFLFLAGFYVLFYRQDRWKEVYAGFLFSLAMLSKLSVIYLVLTFIIFYLILVYRKEAEGGRLEACLKSSASLFVPLLLPLIILFLLRPLSAVYLIWAPRLILQLNFSYLEALKSFFSLDHIQGNLYHLFLMIIFSLNVYGLIKHRNKLFLAVIPGVITFLEVIRMFRAPTDNLTNDYALPVIVFLLMGVVILYSKEKKDGKRILAVSLLAALMIWQIHPLIVQFTLPTLLNNDAENRGFRKLVESPLLWIPPQEGKVLLTALLTEEEFRQGDHLRFINQSLISGCDRQEIQMLPEGLNDYLFFHAPVRELFGEKSEIMTSTPLQSGAALVDEITLIEEKFLNLEYSLIINTPHKSLALNKLLDENLDFLAKNGYTMIYVPNHIYPAVLGDHATYLYFKDEEDARAMISILSEYYRDHFAEICAQSEHAADLIAGLLKAYNFIDLGKTCSSGKEEPSNIHYLNNLQRLLALTAFLAFFLVKRREKRE